MPDLDRPPLAPTDELHRLRPVAPEGAGRRLGHALLQARLFGSPLPRLGRFEVQRKLGEGGMGAVFEAVDPHLGRRVALKVMRVSGQPMSTADLGHEARMLARLSHRNVVQVYELGTDADERYVCMEYVDGPHLGAWLAMHPDATWTDRVRLLLGAAQGLHAAHQAGVIHRDFKLENVLVGTDGVPRVTDFGLARNDLEAPGDRLGPPGVRPSDATNAVSQPSTLAGTPGYLAPELLAGGRADERSDQYAFFVAARAALVPVEGTVPAAVKLMLGQGLSEDPDRRLTDLAAVVRGLEQALQRQPAPDQRARDVLCERVARLWIEPSRARALQTLGGELFVPAEPVASLGPEPDVPMRASLDLGDGSAREIAAALHELRAGVVLIGSPGGGKSTRLLGVASALLERARVDPQATLPVVLNLSSFKTWKGRFEEWLEHELVAKYALPREDARRWLADGQLAMMLDGLDELAGPARVRCVHAINEQRSLRPTAWLVTCREENYRALSPRLDADAVLRLCPLDPSALSTALRGSALSELVAADPVLAEQLRNPLLLALYRQLAGELVREGPDPGALREGLYEAALAHALDQPPPLDSTQRRVERERLHVLAAMMERAGVSELWLEELQASWLPTFSGRALAVGLGLAVAYGISIGLNLGAAVVARQPWTSGLFFGVLAVSAALVIQGGVRIVPMERMGWSWRRVRTWFPRLLLLGVLTGGLHGLFFDFWADLILGVATGVLGLSVIGLQPAGRVRRVNPGDGLLESLRNSLLVAPLIGLVIGAPVGFLALPLARPLASLDSMYHTHPNPELAWAVTMGTSAAVTSLFITGFTAPLMHATLRLTLWMTSPLPLRLQPWLDSLVARDLIHRVGGGWTFRHATLLAWLASGGRGAS